MKDQDFMYSFKFWSRLTGGEDASKMKYTRIRCSRRTLIRQKVSGRSEPIDIEKYQADEEYRADVADIAPSVTLCEICCIIGCNFTCYFGLGFFVILGLIFGLFFGVFSNLEITISERK